jgi:hypothetical protein
VRSQIRATLPRLQALLRDDADDRGVLARSRRAAIVDLGAERLFDDVLAHARGRIAAWTPDPATDVDGYPGSLRWFLAARELNAEDAAVLLARWRVTHKRRRTLWRVLEEHGA